ncbi:MAG: HU family DNA-binding protein, partial [Prevotella sp.]|nr:HU family DNA-binding protein [Prevotella sp.]
MAKVNDFARELSEKYGLSLGDASDFVSAMFDVVKEELDGADSSVKIKGFGTFKVSAVGARASVDVNTGERIIIDGRNKISFTPEVLLRDRVNRPFVQFETVVLNDGVDFSEIDEESEEELDSVTETEPQEVQLSPTAPTSQSTDQSTDQPTFSEQPQGVQLSSTAPTGQSTGQSANPQSPSETASKAVNTEEHRDMARR